MNTHIDISGIVLKTTRLVLRPWKVTDLNDLYEYARVDGVGQMAGWLPHESKETSSRILESFIEGKKTFAIEFQGKVIGSLGVEKYPEKDFPEYDALQGRELGYVLSKDYWGQSLMPEAVKTVMDYLFRQQKLDFIMISHFTRNQQSRRVIEKCGLRYLRNITHRTRYETEEDTRVNVITQQEYLCDARDHE